MKNVLLLRSGDQIGEYGACCPGWRATQMSPIRKSFINLARLRDTMQNGSFCGLILTSRTVVEAVAKTKVAVEMPVFVVGQATGRAVRELLKEKVQIIGEGSGDAVRLAPMIVDYFKGQSSPVNLIHPGATKMIGGLAEKIEPIKSLHVPVYETSSRDRAELEAELSKIDHDFDACVYFSPSGVQAARDVIRARWPRAREIAIGQSTAQALDDCCLVCTDPNPTGKN